MCEFKEDYQLSHTEIEPAYRGPKQNAHRAVEAMEEDVQEANISFGLFIWLFP